MRIKTEQIMRMQPTSETYTVDLYTFDELNDDAREKIIDEFMEERANDPYFAQWFSDAYESEIWACVRDFEQNITGANVQWRYNPWYSCDFDCVYKIKDFDWITPDEMEPVKDTGYYASMDICDAWNGHTRKLNAIARLYSYMSELQMTEYPAYEWEYNGDPCNMAFYNRLDAMTARLHDEWIEELERACNNVRDTIETLLRAEWEYYTSEECARLECEDESTQGGEFRACEYPYYSNGGYTGRVFYSDNRKWYTVDGEYYEQSDVNYECVSIVKAS